jgi:cell division protein FtsZ
MALNLNPPDISELKPRITVFGVGGAGGNAVNNMITAGLQGVDFVVANTDAQALTMSKAQRIVQMGVQVTKASAPVRSRTSARPPPRKSSTRSAIISPAPTWCSSPPAWAAAPAPARRPSSPRPRATWASSPSAWSPSRFTSKASAACAPPEAGIAELHKVVDTLLIIPNQNLFRVANEKTTFADAFAMADQVLYSGVACITDLMVKEGLINLDFADVRAVMREMGKAMMGTGEAPATSARLTAAEAAIANPLIDDSSMKGARGLLISITGGKDLTLFEVDEAATRIREEVDQDANIIVGATFDETLDGDDPRSPSSPPASNRRMPQPAERLAGRPAPRGPESRSEPVSEYAKRPAPQRLDQHGRQTPVHNPSEEDQLDIPAFLRRQAN